MYDSKIFIYLKYFWLTMLVCDIIFVEEFIIILGAGGGGLNTP